MNDAPNSPDTPAGPPADPGRLIAPGGSPVLFPSCDPRGVLGRALSDGAPPWQTRPDALLFGWMLGLAPNVAAAGAARAVLAVADRPGAARTEHQEALVEGLRGIAEGPPNLDPRRG